MIIEVKASDKIADLEVKEKARAAHKWDNVANGFVDEANAKPWHYVLLDEKDVSQSLTLQSLKAKGEP